MADKIDMSLDDIIKLDRTGKRGRGRGARRGTAGRGGLRGTRRGGATFSSGRVPRTTNYFRGDVEGRWEHDMFDGVPSKKTGMGLATGGRMNGPTKLIVSNLYFDVSESDLQELFAEYGLLKSVAVHYDRSGRSLGTADIVFERRSDATSAMRQYNGVPLDGRPMDIKLATSDVGATQRTSSIQQRLSPRRNLKRLGGRAGRGRGGRRGAGGRRSGDIPTVEELDAELDAYINKIM